MRFAIAARGSDPSKPLACEVLDLRSGQLSHAPIRQGELPFKSSADCEVAHTIRQNRAPIAACPDDGVGRVRDRVDASNAWKYAVTLSTPKDVHTDNAGPVRVARRKPKTVGHGHSPNSPR
jgi:hypothetical protein